MIRNPNLPFPLHVRAMAECESCQRWLGSGRHGNSTPPPPPFPHHISDGEHPPNFTVLGKTLCEALPAPAWEGHQGVEAAFVSNGTTVPLSPRKNTVLQWLGTSNVNNLFLKTHIIACAWKYQLAYSTCLATPPPPLGLCCARKAVGQARLERKWRFHT